MVFPTEQGLFVRENLLPFETLSKSMQRTTTFYSDPRLGANATKDGKPIFLFGDIPVYFDSNVIFALRDSQWRPLSLDQLADGIVVANANDSRYVNT